MWIKLHRSFRVESNDLKKNVQNILHNFKMCDIIMLLLKILYQLQGKSGEKTPLFVSYYRVIIFYFYVKNNIFIVYFV